LETPAPFVRPVKKLNAQGKQWVVTGRIASKDPAPELYEARRLFSSHKFSSGVTSMSENRPM
jgi:hypothetical protein